MGERVGRGGRVRRWALGVLLCAFFVWLSMLGVQRVHPDWVWVGYVRAFAEAACIGGLADWFAVVALFRHPLGVPLPHTAILPKKQAQLAHGVAKFFSTHFLDGAMVANQVRRYDLGGYAARWVQERVGVDAVLQRLPVFLQTVMFRVPVVLPDTWVQTCQSLMRNYLQGERLGQGAARALGWAQSEHWDRWVVRRLAQAVLDFCVSDQAADRVRPWLSEWVRQANQYQETQPQDASWWDRIKQSMTGQAMDWADDWLIEKALASGKALAERVLSDDAHPIHVWFSAQCIDWRRQLIEEADVQLWLERSVLKALNHPDFVQWLNGVWGLMHGRVVHHCATDSQWMQSLSVWMHSTLLNQLALPERQEQLNEAMANAMAGLLNAHADTVRAWIAGELNAWSQDRLVSALDEAIGADLQYIRINGALIGGVIGLLMFTLGQFLG